MQYCVFEREIRYKILQMDCVHLGQLDILDRWIFQDVMFDYRKVHTFMRSFKSQSNGCCFLGNPLGWALYYLYILC